VNAGSFSRLLETVRGGKAEIRTDSRRVRQGDVFAALRGSTGNGADFIPQALRAGASAIVCEPDAAAAAGQGSADVIVQENMREALSLLAQARYRTETLPFPVFGVTGTNGKTTVTFLLEHLFVHRNKKTGVLGTINYRWPGHEQTAPLTTPDAPELHRMLAAMREAGVEAAVMEVSSHALTQQRIGGVRFAGAIFTNLTQDHLDYHKDMESYYTAKSELFLHLPDEGKICAVNADDPYGRRLLASCRNGTGFGLESEIPDRPFLSGRLLSSDRNGLHLKMRFSGAEWELRSPLAGAHNASNLLAAQALCLGLGMPPDAFACLERFTGVPGRLERIENPRGLHAFVDYAHTPDALANVLRALRAAGFARLITVFGCGGDRDRAKRPRMGEAAAEYSDVAVLTSDNPRTEDPSAIMADVLPGLAGARRVIQEPDRRKATELALGMLGPEDALLVAGKGHEEYQIIGTERRPYSDRQVIRELLSCA
jgi:UDP-N-acetylmuramoyl-L-alanyl-D-glutamate--2,6-diaminopimelate ligase